jgi:hypothetical protein
VRGLRGIHRSSVSTGTDTPVRWEVTEPVGGPLQLSRSWARLLSPDRVEGKWAVPLVDYMLIADYVRAEAGVMHMIAGGFDQIRTPVVPAARNVGIASRIMLTRAECDYPLTVEFVFQRAGHDDAPLAVVTAEIQASWPSDDVELPGRGDEVGALLSLNIGLPLPDYGQYELHLKYGGFSQKMIPIVVVHPGSGGPSEE